MSVYLLAGGVEEAELLALEDRVRGAIPDLQKVSSIKELIVRLQHHAPADTAEQNYLLVPLAPQDQGSFDRVIGIATQYHGLPFFIIVSDDISAVDYKRLLRTGGADWASLQGAPQEILEIIARHGRRTSAAEPSNGGKPVVVSFVPGAGGVGNATLAMEAAVQLKTGKETRDRTICLIDMDFQASHVCDLLDIEPRLQVEEFARHPERLDAHLLDLFVSRHASGLDVLAAPRSKTVSSELDMAALDALFDMISRRYNFVIVDLPVTWFGWTRQILGASNAAVVTGLVNIPSLRQVTETLEAVRSVEPAPPQIIVALNRGKRHLLRGVAGQQYISRMLPNETIVLVRDDPDAALQSVNTGVPISIAHASSAAAKDIAKLAALLAGLRAGREAATA